MNIIIVVQLIAFVVILLGNVTNGQKQFNQLVGTNNQSMIDMTKQIQINTLLAKCSSTDPNEQCDVCSLCQNGAFCRQTKNKKSKQKYNTDPLSALREIIDFNCYCVPGYTGTYCQIDINECLSMPCSNNATCLDKINSFECDCPKGFKGEYCEINIDECESSPCLYDSKCIDLIDAFHCECMPGYTGTTCSIDINECETKPCANNATCLNLVNKFECNCSSTGFQGALCEIDINDCLNVECQHNSTCVDGINAFECKCQPGFTGRYCEIDIDECLSSPCVYGKCWQNSDPKGFIRRVERLGTLPPSSLSSSSSSSSSISHQRISSDQIIDPNQLDLSFEYKFNYDKAAGYWCECTPGYTGINCETKINECEHNPCGKNGNCLDQINEYKCDCYPGYTGQNCQENINECLSISPCAEKTKCIDLKPDYSVSNLTNNTVGYYCDCNELNLNLFKSNKNRYVSYTGVNCTIKVNSCEANNNLCQHDSVCESVLIDNKQDVKCSCKPGFTGKYCQYLTVIRLDGTYSPESKINFNSKFHLKFDFRIQFYMNKLPLVYFETSNSLLFEVNIFRKYLSISNKNMNIDEKLAFYENNNTWHSFELIKTNDDNNLKLVYSVQQLHLTQTKLIHFNEMAKNDSMIIKFGKFFTNNNKKDYLSSSCIRDVKLNDEYLFVSNNKNTNNIIKFGCDMIKNECNNNFCKNGASCVYKWFTNECTNCLHPFYGKQCQLEATKLGLLNKSPASPLSAYVTLGLIRSARSDTFKMSFQITHINNNDSEEPEQFLFLTLKQLNQNEKMEYFYILSIDENGYLNMKKIQFNLVDLSKTLKWSLSNDKFNLSDVNTFKLNVKMSEFFIELSVDKYISRFELIEEEKSSSLFQIEQIKFSNNFILNNSVSFMITDLRVNDVNYEFSMNENKLQINTLNSFDDVKLEIIESLNANLFNSSQNNNDIILYLNENEHSCPNKNCYKLKEFKQQEFLIKNITCNYINNQCNQYSSIRRNLYKSKNKAELNYYFNFDKNILEENDLRNKTAQLDSNSFNKQRILMLRDIDFYSIGFDLNLNFLKKEINSNFKTNLFILNSLDDANSISKFLFGLNLIVTNQTESGQFIFELFTAKQSIQSGLVKIDELINVNLTFTFNSIDLRINNSSQELMKLTDKTTSLFYRSLLKAYASFQLSLVSNLLNDQSDEFNNRPEPEMSACFSHFYLVTRKINNKLRTYDLIDQVKSIFMIDDLVNNDLNEKCGTTTSDTKSLFFDEQEQRSMIKKDCYLVSKFNANTNEKLNDYYVCKCNTTTDQLCPYNFWSKLDDNSAKEQIPTEEATTALLSCAELNDYACFNNGTCIDNKTQIDNYSCSCAKYFTGKRCEIFDACLSNSCSLQSTCKPKATEFISNTSLFECICDYGYIGEYCTIRVNETCLANPCMNGATCFNVTEIDDFTKMSYECKCTPGFEGKDCQHQIDFCLLNEPCGNGASCINLYHQETMYKCGCTKGWKGINCSVDIDECEIMKAKQKITCSGNGQCLNTKGDFKCVCDQYNYGKNCESTHICKQDPYERPCENGAICLINGDIHFNKYICKCGYGYTGVNCSYPTCDIQPCRHDSTCEMINSTNYECNCTGTGHVGKTCETFVNDIECHMFACNNNTCDPSKCDCKAINCEEYISKYMKPKPKEFMYHFILWPLLGIMFTLLMILFSIFLMKMKKSRATHGTYSPSRHELQASRIEFNMDLKRPPEERLI